MELKRAQKRDGGPSCPACRALWVEFPDELFSFWGWYQSLDDFALETFHNELGIRLCGPFDALAGKFDGVELRYPAVLHWRYSYDPAEFFTIFTGDSDGLHCGYWFDDPGRSPPVIAAYYAYDAFELWNAGASLAETIRERLDDSKRDSLENLEYDSDNADDISLAFTPAPKHQGNFGLFWRGFLLSHAADLQSGPLIMNAIDRDRKTNW